jgi:hypothetical protein
MFFGILPALDPCMSARRAQADEYLAHLVGHEGAGSLLSALKVPSTLDPAADATHGRGISSVICSGVLICGWALKCLIAC